MLVLIDNINISLQTDACTIIMPQYVMRMKETTRFDCLQGLVPYTSLTPPLVIEVPVPSQEMNCKVFVY